MNFHDPIPDESVDAIVRRLEASGDFRVLRRLTERDTYNMAAPGEPTRTGVLVDLETTGLNTATAECIELGMVKFSYTSSNDRVVRVLDTFSSFHEPSVPITPEITQITGITTEMVVGHRIDPTAVAAFLSGTVGVAIAHNSAYDRPIAERFWPEFQHIGWACTAREIDWPALGFHGARLEYLLAGIGFFHRAHRAVDDCRAVLELLAFEPEEGRSVLSLLLQKARRPTVRIWAQAPFEAKDRLKSRRYRWNPGDDGRPRSWYLDVDADQRETELKFLRDEIYCGRDVEPLVREVTAFTRFSNRI